MYTYENEVSNEKVCSIVVYRNPHEKSCRCLTSMLGLNVKIGNCLYTSQHFYFPRIAKKHQINALLHEHDLVYNQYVNHVPMM